MDTSPVIRIDQDGHGTAYDEALAKMELTQAADSATLFVSKSNGTLAGKPIVGITFQVVDADGGEPVTVFTAVTLVQWAMITTALMAHEELKESMQEIFNISDEQVEGKGNIKGTVDGVGYDAIPMNGYMVMIEGEETQHWAQSPALIERLVATVLARREAP